MKTAVILTGHMRCWEIVFPIFQRQILDRYQPDIFISTWSDEGWWRPHAERGFNEKSPVLNRDAIFDCYKPKELLIEQFDQVDHILKSRSLQFTNYLHNPKNVVSMLYKMHSGGLLLEKHIAVTGIEYDIVIRMRPDLIFNMDLPEFDTNCFYTLDHRNHLAQGTGDMFQAGSCKNVIAFTKMLVYLNDVYKQSNSLCPHLISKTWIDILGVKWEEIRIGKRILHSPFGDYVPSYGNTILDLKTEETNKVY